MLKKLFDVLIIHERRNGKYKKMIFAQTNSIESRNCTFVLTPADVHIYISPAIPSGKFPFIAENGNLPWYVLELKIPEICAKNLF